MPEQDYRDLFVRVGAIYLTTVGYGTGTLLGRGIKRVLEGHWLEKLYDGLKTPALSRFGETDDRKDELI